MPPRDAAPSRGGREITLLFDGDCPLLGPLFDRAYGVFARNRRRL